MTRNVSHATYYTIYLEGGVELGHERVVELHHNLALVDQVVLVARLLDLLDER